MSVLCPRCGVESYTPYGEEWTPGVDPPPPALSRLTRGEHDVPLYVCSQCGQEEALEVHFNGFAKPADQWAIPQEVEQDS